MKANKTYPIATIFLVACFASLSVQAAAPRSTPVTVVNDAATPVPVVTDANYRYVGNTLSGVVGSTGFNQINALCEEAHGSRARMCTTREFFRAPVTPGAEFYAWVHPILAGVYYNSSIDGEIAYEYTGYRLTSSRWDTQATCQGWGSASAADRGFVAYSNSSGDAWHLATVACNTSIPATCCAPQ